MALGITTEMAPKVNWDPRKCSIEEDCLCDFRNSSSTSDDEEKPEHTKIQVILGINAPTCVPGVQYFTKFSDRALKHSVWLSESEVMGYSNGRLQLSRLKIDQGLFWLFPAVSNLYLPDYIILSSDYFEEERILSVNVRYFVKWRGLNYDCCTWEDSAPQNLIDEWQSNNAKTVPTKISKRPFRDPGSVPHFNQSAV